ncbi:MAG: hypothetical protein K1X89_22180 [Myxococcaceae bacterium]|nr:hypothetical protein [Myxococcaceae bacterium]
MQLAETNYGVGCGCASGLGAFLPLGGLVLLLRRARRAAR